MRHPHIPFAIYFRPTTKEHKTAFGNFNPQHELVCFCFVFKHNINAEFDVTRATWVRIERLMLMTPWLPDVIDWLWHRLAIAQKKRWQNVRSLNYRLVKSNRFCAVSRIDHRHPRPNQFDIMMMTGVGCVIAACNPIVPTSVNNHAVDWVFLTSFVG